LLNLRRIRTFWIWVVFIFIALLLISSNLGERRSWNPAEQIIIEITAPIQEFISQTVNTIEGVWLKYFALVSLRDENVRLQEEINALRMENSQYRELVATNERLQKLLKFKKTINWPVLASQVIGRDPSGWFESVIIDKGSNAGLKVNMPVVDAKGVVGRLVAVSANYAKVLLIIDQNSAVDSLVQRSREKGIVKGLSPEVCKLDYVLKTGDIAPGDLVVTSGMGRVFPKGLPVGKVLEVSNIPWKLFKDIHVRPLVDFTKLEEVLVILKEDPLLSRSKETE
jgi:rod shape-determining protein MreC